MVSDEAMMDFFLKYNVILKKEDLPSRTTISRTALDDVYESMKTHIKSLIRNTTPRNVALTTDLWSDAFKRNNYITLTLHFLNSELDFKSLTLATQLIEGVKTGEKIKGRLQEIIIEYGLEEKQTVMVTDSGANVKKAVFLSNMDSHLCVGHGLHNLVVQDGVKSTPKIHNIVTKCKKIVKSLRFKLPELQKGADDEQKRLLIGVDEAGDIIDIDELDPAVNESIEECDIEPNNLRVTSIKTSTPTRWHSILVILESMYNPCNRNLIHRLIVKLNKSGLIIEDTEWKLLGYLNKLLKKFRDAVNIMSASKMTTLHVALGLRCEIEASLKQTDDNEVLLITVMKSNMLAKLDHRFPVNKLIIAAALLDCRLQGLRVVDNFLEEIGETRVLFLSTYVKEWIKKSDILKEARNEPISTGSSSSSADLLLAMSEKYSTTGPSTADDPVEVECWKYFGGCNPKDLHDGDLLAYWKEKKCYPWLVTSTPSERVFSVAGLTITAKRSWLSPTAVNRIILYTTIITSAKNRCKWTNSH